MNITEKCTGCMACYNACPFNAIEIIQMRKVFMNHILLKKNVKNVRNVL